MIRPVPSFLSRWAWTPVPALALAIVALWIAGPGAAFESPALLWLTNVAFTGAVALGIAWLAGRSSLSGGQPGLVMLGCGALAWGLGTRLAVSLQRDGNVTVTIHNLSVLVASACHLAGMTRHAGPPRRPFDARPTPSDSGHPSVSARTRRRTSWAPRPFPFAAPLFVRPPQTLSPRTVVAGAYAAVVAVLALTGWATASGRLPVFFVQGQGGTPVRQAVVILSIAMFGLASAGLLRSDRRRSSAVLRWYGWGLALLAVGLLGVLLQSAPGTALNWTARGTQLLAGAYLLLVALIAVKQSGGLSISWAEVEDAHRRGELVAALGREPVRRATLRYGAAQRAWRERLRAARLARKPFFKLERKI